MIELITIVAVVLIVALVITGVFFYLTKDLASNNLKRTRAGINTHVNALIKELNEKR